MANTKPFLLGCVAGVLSVVLGMGAAKAECSQDYLPVVPYSYAESVTVASSYPECEYEAEETACATTDGLECARDMQVVYSACVADIVCDQWVQLALEDSFLDGLNQDQLGTVMSGCVSLVMRAGGEF